MTFQPRNRLFLFEPFEESREDVRQRIFYENRKRSGPTEKSQRICGHVPRGSSGHYAPPQAGRRDGRSRGKRLGRFGASGFFEVLEAYRGEAKGADDVDAGATNPVKEA